MNENLVAEYTMSPVGLGGALDGFAELRISLEGHVQNSPPAVGIAPIPGGTPPGSMFWWPC